MHRLGQLSCQSVCYEGISGDRLRCSHFPVVGFDLKELFVQIIDGAVDILEIDV